MIITPSNLAVLNQSYNALFNTGFKQAAPTWPQVATQVNSTSASEIYAWLNQFPDVREWTGDRHIKSLKAYSYSLVNRDFEVTVSVPSNTIEDNQIGLFSTNMLGMGDSMARHPDKLIFQLLGAADTTVGPDGQYFIDTDHPVGDGTYSNFGGGSGAMWFLMDTTRPLKPLIYQQRLAPRFQIMNQETDDRFFWRKEIIYGARSRGAVGFGMWQQVYGSRQTLNQANFEAAFSQFMTVKSDEGTPLGVQPNLLVVGPSNRAAAAGIVDAQILASGASNLNYKIVNLLVSPYLT